MKIGKIILFPVIQGMKMGEMILFPVWKIPFHVSKTYFEILGSYEHHVFKVFLIQGLEMDEIILFPV